MQTRSSYYPSLQRLLQQPTFSVSEAEQNGIPRHALAYFYHLGTVERVGRGVYRNSTHEDNADPFLEGIAIASAVVPESIVCLISALHYYELTDEIPREHWLAISHSRRASICPGVRVVRMRNMILGMSNIFVEGHALRIFDRERCIIDSFRYLSPEIAIKALQRYLGDVQEKPDIGRLLEYAKKLRVNIKHYLLALTT